MLASHPRPHPRGPQCITLHRRRVVPVTAANAAWRSVDVGGRLRRVCTSGLLWRGAGNGSCSVQSSLPPPQRVHWPAAEARPLLPEIGNEGLWKRKAAAGERWFGTRRVRPASSPSAAVRREIGQLSLQLPHLSASSSCGQLDVGISSGVTFNLATPPAQWANVKADLSTAIDSVQSPGDRPHCT